MWGDPSYPIFHFNFYLLHLFLYEDNLILNFLKTKMESFRLILANAFDLLLLNFWVCLTRQFMKNVFYWAPNIMVTKPEEIYWFFVFHFKDIANNYLLTYMLSKSVTDFRRKNPQKRDLLIDIVLSLIVFENINGKKRYCRG